MEKPKDVIDKILKGPLLKFYNMETYPSQIIFIAAKMNNIKLLVVLIHEYPDLLWNRNDDAQTIYHIAVAHRHWDIHNLLYEIGSMKDLITPITDNQGNNILHLVGKNPVKKVNEDSVTATFQMQSELLWYKEVEGVLPPPYREVKNEKGQTPQELFTENHEKLVSECMKSINDTVNISMVVAALVCTIGFSVAYSIPGGFDQDNGYPMFNENTYFTIFVTMDVLSFLFATNSIMFFLSIILSRKHRNMASLLGKWGIGQLLLLVSILCLVLAFTFSLILLYFQGRQALAIYLMAYLLMKSYLGMCMSFVKVAMSTNKRKPKKLKLYL